MKSIFSRSIPVGITAWLCLCSWVQPSQGLKQRVAQRQSKRCTEVYIAIHANNKSTLKLSKNFIDYFKKVAKKNSNGYRFTVDILDGENILTPYSNEGIDSKAFDYIKDILDKRYDAVRKVGGKFPDNDVKLIDVFDRMIKLSDNSKRNGYPWFNGYVVTQGTANFGRPNDTVANRIESQFRQALRYDPKRFNNLQVNIVGVEQNRYAAVRFLNPIGQQANSASGAKTEWERLVKGYVNPACTSR